MAKTRRLLIIGPSFRRNKTNRLVPAFERYDGLFFRVTKNYTDFVKDIDIAVMLDDLTLVDGITPIPYSEPEGVKWGSKSISRKIVENAQITNEGYLRNKLNCKKYSQVFIAMGKEYATSLPDFADYRIKIIFPTSGGPGPKAAALKEWLRAT